MSGGEAGEDVRRLLVPALRRAEGNVRIIFSLCSVCRVRCDWFPRRSSSVQGRGDQAFSHLAICRRGTRGRHPILADTRQQGGMRFAMKASGMPPFARRILALIAVLAVGGAAVSSVSLYHHYGTSKTSYCEVGENFNCDIVNRSTYSAISGIPVALIGIVGYLALLALATFYRSQAETPARLALASLAGLGFALYL